MQCQAKTLRVSKNPEGLGRTALLFFASSIKKINFDFYHDPADYEL
jgi:hypothetical protein